MTGVRSGTETTGAGAGDQQGKDRPAQLAERAKDSISDKAGIARENPIALGSVAHARGRDDQAEHEPVQLSANEEEQLYRHYSGDDAVEDVEGADDAMTRSEEELHIRKRRRERGRVRLKKYVVTDYVEKKVPVQREEVRMEYEPADDADRRD